MPGTNLTRDEAAVRAALLEVSRYEVDLDLTSQGDTFRSVTTGPVHSAHPRQSTFIDLIAPTVHEVVLNGRPSATSARSSPPAASRCPTSPRTTS